MRYDEITQEVGADEGHAPNTAMEKRFAIRARDLGRAVHWFEEQEDTASAITPVLDRWVMAIQFEDARGASRFAKGAIGRPRWRSAGRTVVYVASRNVEVDSAAEIAFVRGHLHQLGLQDRGQLIDGIAIEGAFSGPELASAFASALNAADIGSGVAPNHL